MPNPVAAPGCTFKLKYRAEACHTCRITELPDPNFGRHGYQVQIVVGDDGERRTSIVKQPRLPIAEWASLMERLGFRIDGIFAGKTRNAFQEETSLTATIAATRSGASARTDLQTFYDDLADSCENTIRNSSCRGSDWLRLFIEACNPVHADILDVGCGTGLVGRAILETNSSSRVFGIDFSRRMVEITRSSHAHFNAIQVDVSAGLPFCGCRAFDIVTAFGVLEFAADHSSLLGQIRESLEIGGEFWGTFEVSDLVPANEAKAKKTVHRNLKHAEDSLRAAGFEVLTIIEAKEYHSPSFNREVFYAVFRCKRRTIQKVMHGLPQHRIEGFPFPRSPMA